MDKTSPPISECHACTQTLQTRPECRDAFKSQGVRRVNWDCWEMCNLSCPFCFRSRGRPLGDSEATDLIRGIAYGGVSHLTLTGGDPSLRHDLGELIDTAHALGMRVEVLTNAHYQAPAVKKALLAADLVGMSLDGASPEIHDSFRKRRGNFDKVLRLMDFLDANDRQYVVRTIASRKNLSEPTRISALLRDHPGLLRWVILQFSPIEEGYLNRETYSISAPQFRGVCQRARDSFSHPSAEFSTLSDAEKVGLYLFVDPQGRAFCRVESPSDGHLPYIGDMTKDHICSIADRITLDPSAHSSRYTHWFADSDE